MKRKTINSINRYHNLLRQNPIYWQIPIAIILFTGAMIFYQLLWVFPEEDEKGKGQDDANLAQSAEFDQALKGVALTVTSPDKNFKPSFAVETKKGWKILNRFEVFESPKKWRVIWVQKDMSFFAPLFSAKPQTWKPIVKEGRVLSIKQFNSSSIDPSKISFSKARNKRFGLQLFSLPANRAPEALKLIEELLEKGHLAYLHRSENKRKMEGQKTESYYYQIRIGFFSSNEEAVEVGEKIGAEFPDHPLIAKKLWVVLPSFAEISAEVADFRVQRNKPYAISFAKVTSFATAKKQLIAVSPFANFSYISSQKGNKGNFQYRLKAGFYENSEAANSALKDMQSEAPRLFRGAKVQRSKDFIEDAELILDQSRILRAAE